MNRRLFIWFFFFVVVCGVVCVYACNGESGIETEWAWWNEGNQASLIYFALYVAGRDGESLVSVKRSVDAMNRDKECIFPPSHHFFLHFFLFSPSPLLCNCLVSAICWKWAQVYRVWLLLAIVSLGFSPCVYTATSAHFSLAPVLSIPSLSLCLSFSLSYIYINFSIFLMTTLLLSCCCMLNARQTEPGSGTTPLSSSPDFSSFHSSFSYFLFLW